MSKVECKVLRLLLAFVVNVSIVNLYGQSVNLYLDSSCPVQERVQDLLSRMTLDEKIDQMRHIHAYSIIENGKIDEKKLESMLQGRSMGFIEAITLPGEECRLLFKSI